MRVLLLIAPLFLVSCTSLEGGDQPRIPQSGVISSRDELHAARDYWKNVGPDDYAFTLTRTCFCLPGRRGPFDVEVRSGAVVRVVQERRTVQAQELEDLNIPTMDGLFALADTAFAEDASRVDLEVEPESGSVRRLYIDRDLRIADEEIGFEITNYRPR